MTRKIKPAADSAANCRRPSERAAHFVLGVTGWVRGIFTSTTITTPRGQVFQHRGNPLPPGRELRFHNILLVEDNPDVSREFVDTINRYYAFGSVRIFAAYAFDAAVSFETIEHLKDGRSFLEEIYRVLCKGGTLICSTPNIRYTSHPPFHIKEYLPEEFYGLVEQVLDLPIHSTLKNFPTGWNAVH